MKIAVVTKRNMQDSVERKGIVDALTNCGEFDVDICASCDDIADDCERVLVFGGDGTMLDVVGKVVDRQIPVLGVNLGNLGFLTEFEKSADIDQIIDALKNGKIASRTLICTAVEDSQCRKSLNEVVVKSENSHPISLDLYVDGHYVDTYRSDGAIVSSSTGSTAYALSAGGPVLAPDVDAFVILPICAHSLHSRPLVVNSASVIRFTLKGTDSASVCIDGAYERRIQAGENIYILRADKNAKFVTVTDDGFYKKLFQKMNSWGTTITVDSKE